LTPRVTVKLPVLAEGPLMVNVTLVIVGNAVCKLIVPVTPVASMTWGPVPAASASSNACLNDPAPASLVLVTVKVLEKTAVKIKRQKPSVNKALLHRFSETILIRYLFFRNIGQFCGSVLKLLCH